MSATGILTAEFRLPVTCRTHQKGFTFLEILAVVVIIAITVTFAGLSLGSRAAEDRLDTEARRLEALLRLAADEAIVQGEEIGLLVASDGYAFYHLEDNRWAAYEEGSLRERSLPEDLKLRLVSDGREDLPLPLPTDTGADGDEAKRPSPQILLLSSGELTPFVLELHASGLSSHYRAEGSLTGQIELKRVTDSPA